jgi:hypothetical protein
MSTRSNAKAPAIPARHNRAGDALVYWGLVRSAIWSHFDRVWLRVDGPLPRPGDGPLINYIKHPTGGDCYMAYVLNRGVLRDSFQGYLMMEEQELRRYQFFAWSGAFSVDRQDARSALRSVAYIAQQLAEQRDRALMIFPQGEITPNDRRPLVAFPGIAHIARRAGGATLWPAALRYEFRGEQRPEAFIRAGTAHRAPADADTHALTAEISQRLTAACDALRDEVNEGKLEQYRVLLRGRTGANRAFDALRRRLPSWRGRS